MTKKRAADRLVIVREEDWKALVNFLRDEEKTVKDSYNTPGKNDWEVFYKENHKGSWSIYDAARRAAKRKPCRIAQR